MGDLTGKAATGQNWGSGSATGRYSRARYTHCIASSEALSGPGQVCVTLRTSPKMLRLVLFLHRRFAAGGRTVKTTRGSGKNRHPCGGGGGGGAGVWTLHNEEGGRGNIADPQSLQAHPLQISVCPRQNAHQFPREPPPLKPSRPRRLLLPDADMTLACENIVFISSPSRRFRTSANASAFWRTTAEVLGTWARS
jgi:hypothetical protein